jgi:hypothetical protein
MEPDKRYAEAAFSHFAVFIMFFFPAGQSDNTGQTPDMSGAGVPYGPDRQTPPLWGVWLSACTVSSGIRSTSLKGESMRDWSDLPAIDFADLNRQPDAVLRLAFGGSPMRASAAEAWRRCRDGKAAYRQEPTPIFPPATGRRQARRRRRGRKRSP